MRGSRGSSHSRIGKKGYVWQPTRDYTIQEIVDNFPELYKYSLYYNTVAEALGERIDMEEAMRVLYEISGGSEKKPTISEIKKRLTMHKSVETIGEINRQ